MLDYASLAALVAVVREGSFERAARVLHVTPSAISQRVKALEERLGSVLIVRGQPCTATDSGRLLCRHVEQVEMLESELQGLLPERLTEGPQGGRVLVRVAVNADSLGTWFIDAMAAFLQSDSALFDVQLDDQDHTHEWLRNGEVQAAVTGDVSPVQGCDIVSLGKLRYCAVASPDYVRRYFPDGVNANALAGAPSLVFNRKDRLQAQWVRNVCRRTVELPAHWLPSTGAFIDATLAGIGWGMNPHSLVARHLEAGTLVELLPGRSLTVPLYWQHTRLRVPTLERLTRTVVTIARTKLRSVRI